MGVTIVAMSDTPAGNKSSANNITIQTDIGNVTNVQEEVEINATIEDIDNLTDRYKKNEEELNGTAADYHHKVRYPISNEVFSKTHQIF